MPDITLTQEQLDERLAAARAEAQQTAQAQFAAQGQELAELRSQRQAEKAQGLINGWKSKGLILPADEAGLREFMGALDQAEAFEFTAAGAAAPTKKSLLDFFAEFVSARKPAVKLGGGAGGAGGADDDLALDLQDPVAINAAAVEFQKAESAAGRSCSFEFAVQQVANQAQA